MSWTRVQKDKTPERPAEQLVGCLPHWPALFRGQARGLTELPIFPPTGRNGLAVSVQAGQSSFAREPKPPGEGRS